MFQDIITFKAGELSLTIPFTDWTEAGLRVIAQGTTGVIELVAGTDYTVAADVVTVDASFSEYPITLAFVPCDDIALPKFGRVENADLQRHLDQLKAYAQFVEVRQTDLLRLPFCPPANECLFPVYHDGGYEWLNQDDYAEVCDPVPGGYAQQIADLVAQDVVFAQDISNLQSGKADNAATALSIQNLMNAIDALGVSKADQVDLTAAVDALTILANDTSAVDALVLVVQAQDAAIQAQDIQIADLLSQVAGFAQQVSDLSDEFAAATTSISNNQSALGQALSGLSQFQP